MKIAILQVADTGPLESLVVMLRHAGYRCLLPNRNLQSALRDLGCDTVLEVEGLVKNWGYEAPIELPLANPTMMENADLYVDVKAHRNGPLVWKRWPNLRDKTLWYRINGCAPEHVVKDGNDYGDEINPPCPILTPNQWYKDHPRAYTCWPPFYRWSTYGPRDSHPSDSPICLIHNLVGWGYGRLVPIVSSLGVKCYGVRSPDGLINHSEVRTKLKTAKCVVHLKSSDAPGYALYEALATACPIILTRRLIWRSKMGELFEPGVNCLVFDRETHDNLSDEDVTECKREILEHLQRLDDPVENRRIGEAGRARLKELLWTVERDGQSLTEFLGANYQ